MSEDQAQYQNMMNSLSAINQAGETEYNEKKEDISEKLAEHKKTIEMTTEGIGGGVVHDAGMNLVKFGVEKLKDKIPVPMAELKNMIADYQDGGADKMFKGMAKRGYSNAKKKLFGDDEGDDAEGAVKKVFGNLFESSSAQDPATILKSLPDVIAKQIPTKPSPNIDFKSIDNQKDFTQAQKDLNDRVSKLPKESQDNIEQKLIDNPDVKTSEEIKNLPQSERLGEKVKQSEARQTATSEEEDLLKPPEIPKPLQALSGTEEDTASTNKGFFQSLLDKIKQPSKPTPPVVEEDDDDSPASLQKPNTLSQVAEDDLKTTAEGEVKTEAKDEGGKLLEKVGERVAETDLEGGGPEDPIGDVVSAVVGIGTLIGGIFGAKSKHLPPPPAFHPLNSSFQAGA